MDKAKDMQWIRIRSHRFQLVKNLIHNKTVFLSHVIVKYEILYVIYSLT